MSDVQRTQVGPTNRLDDLLAPDVVRELSTTRDLRSTGFDPLDGVLTGGFVAGELVVVAGRPGVGKSITLLQWARNLAIAGRNVALAYYEHSELVLLCQLLLIEVGEATTNSVETLDARALVEDIMGGRIRWDTALSRSERLAAAADRMQGYSLNLTVLDRGGRRGGLGALESSVQAGHTDILVVDHLQKVMDGHVVGSAGVTAKFCKSLAVDSGITVLASTVVEDVGIDSRRLRMGQLVDAAAIAHEADVEIVLNNKLPMVSRNHTAFDTVKASSFRNQVIFSLEKNRRGLNGVDMEFTRDFAHRRFDPHGGFVSEHLIDGVTVLD